MSTTSNNSRRESSDRNQRNVLHDQINRLSTVIKQECKPFNALVDEVGEVIVGQEKLIHRMLIGLLANGHLLIEGVPGLAKTTQQTRLTLFTAERLLVTRVRQQS